MTVFYHDHFFKHVISCIFYKNIIYFHKKNSTSFGRAFFNLYVFLFFL